ncbi:MAG: STAS domain-containing protein [Magnetospiraceae bacterium]
MKMTVTPVTDDVKKVTLAGDMDLDGATKIDVGFAAVAGNTDKIMVDLSEVGFLASIGIRTLLVNAKTVQRRGGNMVVVNPQPMVEKVLRTSSIDQFIAIYPNADEALAALTA